MCCFLYIKDDFLIDINIEEYFVIVITTDFVIILNIDVDEDIE
jgi:hypothetical protein